MSEPEIDTTRFKDRLVELRNMLSLVEHAGDEAARTVELDQSRVGRLSRMDAMQAQAMSIEAKRRRENQIRRVDAALRRIDSGEYGYCLDCGDTIDPGRLEFDPAAVLCIGCANKAEQ